MIGVFDSGIGGLFLLKELSKRFPKQSFIYLVDKTHFPYGEKGFSCIRALVKKNVDILVSHGAEQVIAACNTASIVLGEENNYPVPVKGVIEASLKQANRDSINKKVGLLATVRTVHSQAFLKKAKELNFDLHIYQQACPLLAPFVEQGGWKINQEQSEKDNINHSQNEKLSPLLQEYLKPLINKGIDTVILGCTHYLYLKSAIWKFFGKDKKVAGPVDFLIRDLLEMETQIKKKEVNTENKKINSEQIPKIESVGDKVGPFINDWSMELEKQYRQIWKNQIKINLKKILIC